MTPGGVRGLIKQVLQYLWGPKTTGIRGEARR
jgi:hypothetical protein